MWKLVGGRISFRCGKFLEWLLLFREKCERAAWESNNAIFYFNGDPIGGTDLRASNF